MAETPRDSNTDPTDQEVLSNPGAYTGAQYAAAYDRVVAPKREAAAVKAAQKQSVSEAAPRKLTPYEVLTLSGAFSAAQEAVLVSLLKIEKPLQEGEKG